MGYRGRERGGQRSEEWDTEEGNGVDSTQRNGYRESVDSTQRNGIQRKGTGWTALRGMEYRERGGQHSEEWDTEEGVDSTQRNGIQRKETGGQRSEE